MDISSLDGPLFINNRAICPEPTIPLIIEEPPTPTIDSENAHYDHFIRSKPLPPIPREPSCTDSYRIPHDLTIHTGDVRRVSANRGRARPDDMNLSNVLYPERSRSSPNYPSLRRRSASLIWNDEKRIWTLASYISINAEQTSPPPYIQPRNQIQTTSPNSTRYYNENPQVLQNTEDHNDRLSHWSAIARRVHNRMSVG